jgi:hypothetical protein
MLEASKTSTTADGVVALAPPPAKKARLPTTVAAGLLRATDRGRPGVIVPVTLL